MIATDPELRVPRGALPKRELGSFVREACAAIALQGQVSVLLTTDGAVQELNRTFRRKNKPTDVLSFPAADVGSLSGTDALAGDLAISVDTAARQAVEFGHSLLLEVKVLLLHGLLHLAGFDHEQDTGQMARRERALRRRFELPVGLIQRAAVVREAKVLKLSLKIPSAHAQPAPERSRSSGKTDGKMRMESAIDPGRKRAAGHTARGAAR